jgi:Flp pilus assembly protein TadB
MTALAAALTAATVLLVLGRRRPATWSIARLDSAALRRSNGSLRAGKPRTARSNQPRRTTGLVRRTGTVIGPFASLVVAGPSISIVVIGVSMLLRRWRRIRIATSDQQARANAVPELIEALVVLIEAGCAPAQAIRDIARQPPPPLAGSLQAVVAHLEVGVRLPDALDQLVDAAGENARVLVDTIVRAEVYGDPLTPLLLRLHDEANRQRRHLAEIAARQLPIRLCFPLVCCTLPSFAILTIVPLLAGAFSSLHQSPF